MTLVVARVLADSIHFVSDTRRTREMRYTLDIRDKDPLVDGLLKCIAISPSICIGFAGDVIAAEGAIAPLLRRPDGSRDEVRRHLLRCHGESRRDRWGSAVDFLLATSDPNWGIDRIWHGVINTNLPVAWIGSAAAYNKYQATSLQNDPSGVPLRETEGSRMDRAIRSVVESGLFTDVGDTWVHAKAEQVRGYRYNSRYESSEHLPVENTTTPTSMLRSVGVEGGSFRVMIMAPYQEGVAAIGIYVVENRSGALFYPATSWNSHVYRGVSQDEFVAAVRRKFNLLLR